MFVSLVGLKHCFDVIDRQLLFNKLLLNGVDGKIYSSIKAIYNESLSPVRVRQQLTDWFISSSSVKQSNCMSPTLFAVFINDLVTEINDLQLGVPIGDRSISTLLYADDIALTAKYDQVRQVTRLVPLLIRTNQGRPIQKRTQAT